ncbi:MAG TPA: hypothetical protein VFN54_03095, partial [Acidimicrobiales bacterium]|nr:hypothetical protein [Acidimicrobiales bacterium]
TGTVARYLSKAIGLFCWGLLVTSFLSINVHARNKKPPQEAGASDGREPVLGQQQLGEEVTRHAAIVPPFRNVSSENLDSS